LHLATAVWDVLPEVLAWLDQKSSKAVAAGISAPSAQVLQRSLHVGRTSRGAYYALSVYTFKCAIKERDASP
jgi:hypothetical protein